MSSSQSDYQEMERIKNNFPEGKVFGLMTDLEKAVLYAAESVDIFTTRWISKIPDTKFYPDMAYRPTP